MLVTVWKLNEVRFEALDGTSLNLGLRIYTFHQKSAYYIELLCLSLKNVLGPIPLISVVIHFYKLESQLETLERERLYWISEHIGISNCPGTYSLQHINQYIVISRNHSHQEVRRRHGNSKRKSSGKSNLISFQVICCVSVVYNKAAENSSDFSNGDVQVLFSFPWMMLASGKYYHVIHHLSLLAMSRNNSMTLYVVSYSVMHNGGLQKYLFLQSNNFRKSIICCILWRMQVQRQFSAFRPCDHRLTSVDDLTEIRHERREWM